MGELTICGRTPSESIDCGGMTSWSIVWGGTLRTLRSTAGNRGKIHSAKCWFWAGVAVVE